MCHESEHTEYVFARCVIDDGLAHRKRSSGRACKPPTGAIVKSYGTERVWKRPVNTGQVRTRKMNENEPLSKHRNVQNICQNYPL